MNQFLIFLALIPTFAQAQDTSPDCDTAYQKHLASDLKLSYQEFDQTMDAGFRTLSRQGCERQAADLIETYMRATGTEKSSMRWHVAQLRAHTNDYPAAIRWARLSLSDKEDFSSSELRWNDYVLATIAFLERNLKALHLHRNNVAAAADKHFGNALNVKYLDAMIKYFDKDYKFVSGHIE